MLVVRWTFDCRESDYNLISTMSEVDDITQAAQMALDERAKRWDESVTIRLSSVVWEVITHGEATWLSRLESLTNLVKNFTPDDYTMPFFQRQLALAIFDVNRMEGTISPEMENGVTFGKINAFLSEDCVAPEQIEWDAEGGRDQGIKSSDRQLYQTARAAIFLLVDNRDSPLSLDLIVETYRIMMSGSYNEDKNRHRTVLVVDRVRNGKEEVNAGWYQFVPASAVEVCVKRIAAYYNSHRSDMHPIAAATYLFYEMITVHPFMNGNGRLCRLLLAWSLLKDGFPFPVSFSSGHCKRRKHYIHAIESARKPVHGHRGELNTTLLVSMERVLGNYMENKRLLASVNDEEV